MAANRREIDIAGKTLIIHDHDLSLESAAAADLGLGATVWDCAIILANYLPTYALTRPLPSFYVLELGSGTGLHALAAASLSAPRVTLTDLPLLLPGLDRNVQVNPATMPAPSRPIRTSGWRRWSGGRTSRPTRWSSAPSSSCRTSSTTSPRRRPLPDAAPGLRPADGGAVGLRAAGGDDGVLPGAKGARVPVGEGFDRGAPLGLAER